MKIVDRLAEKPIFLKHSEVEGILYEIYSHPGISSSELIQKTGLPKETLKDFKTLISAMLKPAQGDSIEFREEAKLQLKQENLRQYMWSLVSFEDKELAAKLKEIRIRSKLIPDRQLDQFFATEQTSVNKTIILNQKGLLEGQKIAFLGDDDLVSLTTILAGNLPKEIAVLDVDNKLLAAIETESRKMGTNIIRSIKYDVRDELPKQLYSCFDVVITDPPYTVAGVTLFLNRAIELIGQQKPGKYIFFYFGNSFKNPEKALKIQEIFSRANLVIEDKIDKFARYNGAESIGSTSSLYILKTTSTTAQIADYLDKTPIYTFEETKDEKFPYVDHFTFKLFGVPSALFKSRAAMLKITGEFCTQHKLKVVDQKVTQFKNSGLTITFILSNSNLLVHTWPELNAVYVDLITCSPIYNRETLGQSSHKLFNAKNVEMKRIE